MRRTTWILPAVPAGALAALLVVVAGDAPAAAGDDACFPFEGRAATPGQLRARLDTAVSGFCASNTSKAGTVTVASREDAAYRLPRAETVRETIDRAAGALRAAGWDLPAGRELSLPVVSVRVTGAPPLVVDSTDGVAVLVREGDAPEAAGTAPPPAAAPAHFAVHVRVAGS